MVLESSCNMQCIGLTRRPKTPALRHKNDPVLPFNTSIDKQHRYSLMGSLFTDFALHLHVCRTLDARLLNTGAALMVIDTDKLPSRAQNTGTRR